jgi:alkanesulfonate monooxygenase SsuD/methylene tetrahydromethanopterin reductase-like flavin-dependent oxidoreductase (luciferase family)
MPITSSKESIEFAGKHDIAITPGLGSIGLQQDVIRYFAKCLAAAGHRIEPRHISLGQSVYIADSKAAAVKENGPYHLYFNRTLYSHGNVTEHSKGEASGYVSSSSMDYIRPENRSVAERARADFRSMTMEDVARQAETLPWGNAAEVTERLINAANRTGAGTILVSFNRGAMPQEIFLEQIRRFAREVLPAVQAHDVGRVPVDETIGA